MTSPVLARPCRDLAHGLSDLKAELRTSLAGELAGRVGGALRDLLVLALLNARAAPNPPAARERRVARPPVPRRWPPDDESEGELDPWRADSRAEADDSSWGDSTPEPAAAPCDKSVGVQLARWCLARHGRLDAAVGVGLLATALHRAGGPVARAALAVLTATADLLTAERALARIDRTE